MALCAASLGLVKPPMAHSQPKLPSWSENSNQLTVESEQFPVENESSQPITESSSLPCLDSSSECVEKLTQAAIANSSKLKTLDDRIALIDRRLGVSKDSIDYAESKLWTNYLPTSSVGGSVLDIINPFAWIKNLAGGGDMQRDKLAIADLEIKAATLEAARAELERQREEEKVNLGDRVLRLVLDYESSDRTIALIQSQQKTFNLQNEVFRIQYRLGQGSTEQLLGMTTRGDRLNEQLTDASIKRDEAVREMRQLTGYGKGEGAGAE
jgi:hypothetical protein